MRGLYTAAASFLLAISCHVCSAAPIIIDDFSTGPLSAVLDQNNPNFSQTQTGLSPSGTVGGHRIVGASLNFPFGPTDQATITIDTASQTFHIATNVALENYALSYGLRTLFDGTPDQALNLDLTNQSGFQFNVTSSSASQSATVSVRSGVDEGDIDSSFANLTIPAGATSLFLPFSSFFAFGTPADFTDIDYITFSSTLSAESDVTFDGFFASDGLTTSTPEPTSGALLLMAVGLGAIRCRRRSISEPSPDAQTPA